MARYAWTAQGRKLDAGHISDADWLIIAQGARNGTAPLHCDECHEKGYGIVPLRARTTVHVRRHFFHVGGVPRGCTNTSNESDAHKELKKVVGAAYETVKGITAVEELPLHDADGEPIRVDVAATRGLEPVSLAEIQLSAQPVDQLWKRNLQRRGALSTARDGYARTTPWLTTKAFDVWYGNYPALYLSQDGQRVTDGIYAPHPSGGGDTDRPVEFDIDQWAAATLNGQLIQIGGPADSETYWVDNRRNLAKPKAGKRRKPKGVGLRPLPNCDRPTSSSEPAPPPPPLERRPTRGADAHILGHSMSGKWARPPLQPWTVELVGGPYRGCVLDSFRLGDHVSVIGEHGRAIYARSETVGDVHYYQFERLI